MAALFLDLNSSRINQSRQFQPARAVPKPDAVFLLGRTAAITDNEFS
jgi:hypothetical protein